MHCYQLSLISPNAIIFIHFLQPYPFSSMYNVHCTSISPTFHFFNQFVHRTPLLPFQPPSSMLIHDHSFHPPSSSMTSSTITTMIFISVQLLDHPLVYIVISSSWSSHTSTTTITLWLDHWSSLATVKYSEGIFTRQVHTRKVGQHFQWVSEQLESTLPSKRFDLLLGVCYYSHSRLTSVGEPDYFS